MNGFKQLEKMQRNLKKTAKEFENKDSIPLSELLTDSFIQKHSSFANFDEFMKHFGCNEYSQQELDQKISETTSFNSWEKMLDTAAEQYFTRKLKF